MGPWVNLSIHTALLAVDGRRRFFIISTEGKNIRSAIVQIGQVCRFLWEGLQIRDYILILGHDFKGRSVKLMELPLE